MRAYKSSDLDKDSYVNKREFPVLLRYLGSEVFEFMGMGGYVGFWKGTFYKTTFSKSKISKKKNTEKRNYFSSQECHLLQQGLDRWELGKPPKRHKKPAKSMMKSRSSIRWMLIQIGDWPFQSFDKGCHCLE